MVCGLIGCFEGAFLRVLACVALKAGIGASKSGEV